MSSTCPPLPPFLNSLLSAIFPSLPSRRPLAPRANRAARVFPFSLTLLVYFFLLSSPRAYVTAGSLSHRNQQHCYALLGITASSSFCFKALHAASRSVLRTFRSSLVISLSLSLFHARYDACGIDSHVLLVFLSLSPPARRILSRSLAI